MDARYPGTQRDQIDRAVRMQHSAADPSIPPVAHVSKHLEAWHKIALAAVFFAGLIVSTVVWFDSRPSRAELVAAQFTAHQENETLKSEVQTMDRELAVLKQAFADQVETNRQVLDIMRGWNQKAETRGRPTPFPVKGAEP